MVRRVICFHFVLVSSLLLLLLSQVSSKKHHGNPAKELVDIINTNRTSAKLPSLYDNSGLGCMALQYAEHCKFNCSTNNTLTCHPSEDNFTEVFAPDCGIELPTFDIISGIIVGCHTGHLDPPQAFSEVLFRDNNSISALKNKTHTEVGVGLASVHKHHQFLWCVLFSSGQRNSSFVLEHHGLGIKQRQGCFSGTNITCSLASRVKGGVYFSGLLGVFILLFLQFMDLKFADASFFL